MRSTALRLTALILIFSGITQIIKAQSAQPINVVTTAVPFLRISADARAAGMGDLGVATSPDANGGFWNLAKVPYNISKGGISASYTPWLKDILNDVYLASVAGYYKFDEVQAISGSLRYFSLGNIQFTDNLGNDLNTFRPRELGVDVGYSRCDESGVQRPVGVEANQICAADPVKAAERAADQDLLVRLQSHARDGSSRSETANEVCIYASVFVQSYDS